MAKKKFGAVAEKLSPAESSQDEVRLAAILAQPEWTRQQAQQVFVAQVHGGLTIAQFAKQRGVTAGWLYNWKTKLRPGPGSQPWSQAPEAEPPKLASLQDVELDLSDPGERFMYDYLQRATQGPEPMWQLLAIARQGLVLLCVVRWAQRAVESGSYSLVQLELREPALRWNDFPTAEAATQALQQRGRCATLPPREPSLPTLVPVQVRGQKALPQSPLGEPQPPAGGAPCMTICLPSGVRIQLGSRIPRPLWRAVLRALETRSC